ncbi:hypothetical protein CBS147326_9581 [Penicillium roqueforti]|nr:hypothetical protein CBS147354_8726 [Penicillium roqueforti]KAI3120181.1 hypothetical protein CBS147326_9581 [Penicillium roqueforti]KAI3256218.1 hypothetical protein CBS147309_7894 [Penicillium roqueforti]
MENNKESTVAITPVAAVEPTPTPTPDTTVEPTATTTRSLPVADPMAIIPAQSGPPPQYDEHQKDAITAPAPAATLPQTNEKAVPTGLQVPVAHSVIPLAQVGEKPAWICCPFCFHEVQTIVNKESTSATTMAAVCCCIFGGICCACLPFCMELCHDSHHFCPNCGAKVAIHPHEDECEVQTFGPDSTQAIIQAPGFIQPPQAVMKN